MAKVMVEGLDGLLKKCEATVPGAVYGIMDKALTEGCEPMRAAMERNAGSLFRPSGRKPSARRPTRKSLLAPGIIRTELGGSKASLTGAGLHSILGHGGKFAAFVGMDKDAFHGAMLEKGTPHMEPKPWMRPAYDAHKGAIPGRVGAVVAREVEAVVRR